MPGLSEEDVDPDPISQFLSWYGYAPGDAVALVTASPQGLPSGRMVLLKGVDKSGFVFFTNYGSPKARDLVLAAPVFEVLSAGVPADPAAELDEDVRVCPSALPR